jgi:SnoaL-like protein
VNTTEQLVAIEHIKNLKAQYFRFVDTKDWDRLRRLFTQDAVVEFPAVTPDAMNLEDSMAFLQAALDGAVSIHLHMPEIEILSEDSARGIFAVDDRVYWSGDKAVLLGHSQLRGFGHYRDSFQRAGGEWRIRTLRLTRLRQVTQERPRTVD